jgi:hypothetical protein
MLSSERRMKLSSVEQWRRDEIFQCGEGWRRDETFQCEAVRRDEIF